MHKENSLSNESKHNVCEGSCVFFISRRIEKKNKQTYPKVIDLHKE